MSVKNGQLKYSKKLSKPYSHRFGLVSFGLSILGFGGLFQILFSREVSILPIVFTYIAFIAALVLGFICLFIKSEKKFFAVIGLFLASAGFMLHPMIVSDTAKYEQSQKNKAKNTLF